MSDPIFDETLIEHLLAVPVTPDTADAIQAGAVQTLIDLYDRKVTREEFMTSGAACVALYGQCAKYWMLQSVYRAFKNSELSDEHFVSADKGLAALIEEQAKKVQEIVGRLKQCPTSKDIVN